MAKRPTFTLVATAWVPTRTGGLRSPGEVTSSGRSAPAMIPSGKEIGGRWGPARTITVLVTATLAILIPTTVITVAETVVDGWHH
jgi:hypothetical protein